MSQLLIVAFVTLEWVSRAASTTQPVGRRRIHTSRRRRSFTLGSSSGPTLHTRYSPGSLRHTRSRPAHASHVPAYLTVCRPESNLPLNAQFNFQVSQVRVRSEHCIGFLKGRFQALRGLRIRIDTPEDLRRSTAGSSLRFASTTLRLNTRELKTSASTTSSRRERRSCARSDTIDDGSETWRRRLHAKRRISELATGMQSLQPVRGCARGCRRTLDYSFCKSRNSTCDDLMLCHLLCHDPGGSWHISHHSHSRPFDPELPFVVLIPFLLCTMKTLLFYLRTCDFCD